MSSGLVLQSGQTYFISASASLREAIGSLNLSIVAPYLGLLGSLAATCLARHNARPLPGAGLLPDRRMLITKLIYPIRRPAVRQSRKDDRGPDSPVERAASGGLCLSEPDEGEGIFGALHGQS